MFVCLSRERCKCFLRLAACKVCNNGQTALIMPAMQNYKGYSKKLSPMSSYVSVTYGIGSLESFDPSQK